MRKKKKKVNTYIIKCKESENRKRAKKAYRLVIAACLFALPALGQIIYEIFQSITEDRHQVTSLTAFSLVCMLISGLLALYSVVLVFKNDLNR